MIERIKQALGDCGVPLWRMNDNTEETAELFFVRQQLDTRRFKDVRKVQVTVFRDVENPEGGLPLRGATSVTLLESMDDARLREELTGAWYAAQFAANPYYDLPDPAQAPLKEKTGPLAQAPLAESAGKMARALFAPDRHQDAFVNSAEIFVARTRRRILSSNGTDVSYTDAQVNGEFVVQCREPEDVEIHNTFRYNSLDGEALTQKVAEALGFTVEWDQQKRETLLISDQGKVSLSVGRDSYQFETAQEAVGLSAPQSFGAAPEIQDPGVTWAPVQVFELLAQQKAVSIVDGSLQISVTAE